MQRGFQFFARSEVVASKHIFDAAVESLDHAVGLRGGERRLGKAPVERFSLERAKPQTSRCSMSNALQSLSTSCLMLPTLRPFTKAKQPVGKRSRVIRCPTGYLRSNVPKGGKNGADAQWAGALKVAQEATRIGRCLAVVDADKDPASSPIDRNKQVMPRSLICHLRQVFQVDMDVPRFIGLEAAVLGSGDLFLQIAQVAYAMPPKTPIKSRARNIRIQKLTHYGQKIIQ
jgi:hypothetical protein